MNSHAYDGLADTYYRSESAPVAVRERSSLGHASRDTPLFALPIHTALLDANGAIVAANEDWQGLANGSDSSGVAIGRVGMDYLAVCRQAFALRDADADAGEIEAGIRAVLDGTRPLLSTEYSHTSPMGRRWFLLQVSQLPSSQSGAVVVHVDITERKLSEVEWASALMRAQIKRAELERSRSKPVSAPEATAVPSAEPAGIARLRALEALTDTALSQLAPDDLMRELLGRLTAAMRVDNAAILLLEEDGKTLTTRAAQGAEELVMGQVRVLVGQGFAGHIAATRKPLLVDDLSSIEVVTPLLSEKLRSLVGVPLLVDDHLVGVVHVGSASARHFTQEDVDLLLVVADRIAPSVERARLYAAEREARARAEEALAWTIESEARATERAEALQTILETMADGVAVFDRTGHITQTNHAFSEQFALVHFPGFETQSPIGASQTVQMLDTADTSVLPEHLPISRALRGEVVKGPGTDLRIHAADGLDRELTVSAAPLRDREGHIEGAVVVTRDISWRKRLEREREEAHASELALKETTQRLDEFLATAAHDLRSPLAVTTTAIDLAISRVERLAVATAIENLPQAQKLGPIRSCLDEARNSVDRLSRMVSMLFDTAQVRAGTLRLRLGTCRLARVVREQVDALRKANPHRDIRLETPHNRSVRVVADADRIGQVVANYVTNALKYSPDDQPIHVRVAAEGTLARVSVRDHGRGLPSTEQERIWERFYRVRSVQPSNKQATGLGLGLHISKTIIDLHGGQVGVESAVGAGSTFWFTLPLGQPKA